MNKVPILCLLVLMTLGRPTQVMADAWAALREPGSVVIMRHALAPGEGGQETFVLDDCSTQRNLNQKGRDQARAIGAAFRRHEIAVDRILTSQWCRCEETSRLLDLAPVETFPPLNYVSRDSSSAEVKIEKLRSFLAGLPDDKRIVMVTHQVTISMLTGAYPYSGEAFVIQVADDGKVTVRGSIMIEP